MQDVQDEVVQTVESIADLSRLLADLEAAGELMVDYYMQERGPSEEEIEKSNRVVRTVISDVQQQALELRSYLTRLQSTVVVRDLGQQRFREETLQKLGFKAYVDSSGLEVSLPYDWVASSASFLFRAKSRAHWEGLTNVAGMWHSVMYDLLQQVKPYVPFEMPLVRTRFDIVLYKPVNNLGDPDHFWMRPVIDSFVHTRVILSDNASSVHIHVGYEYDKEHPELRIRVSPLLDEDIHSVRLEGLEQVI